MPSFTGHKTMDNNGVLGWRVSFGSCKYMIFFSILSIGELYFIVLLYHFIKINTWRQLVLHHYYVVMV